ncbi:MAG TPA: CPBP family intramembrane glutamic endopeptidase [Longimicrobium sp.]|nr:CPBP family intramembrane glutamic endopeptidase [Longimicrobium sp.]
MSDAAPALSSSLPGTTPPPAASRRPRATLSDRVGQATAEGLGLLLLTMVWTATTALFLVWPSIPALPAVAASAALFTAVHLRTPRQRARLRLRRIPLPAWAVVLAALATAAWAAASWRVWQHLLPSAASGSPPYADALRQPGVWLAAGIATLLLGPLVEEVGYRGWIQGRFTRLLGVWPALVITALVFAATHGRPRALPVLLATALVFGAARRLSGSLWLPIVLHVAANASNLPGLAGWELTVPGAAVLAPSAAAILVWLGVRYSPRARRRRATARRATTTAIPATR